MSLLAFSKKYCCNNENGDCILSNWPCRLANGNPCKHFRDAVWPICDPSYPFSSDRQSYYRNLAEYQAVFKKAASRSVRICQCGQTLRKRQRYCQSCALKCRRATYRKSKAKKAGYVSTLNCVRAVVSPCFA